MRSSTRVLSAAVLMSVACAQSLQATNWTGAAGNGLWFDPANWSAGVPSATTDAIISVDNAVVSIPDGQTAEALSLNLVGNSSSTVRGGTVRTSTVNGFYSPIFPTIGESRVYSNLELIGNSTGAASVNAVILERGLSESATIPPTTISTFNVNVDFGTVSGTNFAISGTYFSSTAKLSAVTASIAGQVTFDGLGGNTDHINDGAVLTLTDTYDPFTLNGTGTERIGTFDVPYGSPSLVLGAGMTARLGTLNVGEGALLRLKADSSSGSKLIIENVPALVGGDTGTGIHRGIATWAISSDPRNQSFGYPQDLLTYDSGVDPNDPSDDVGLRKLDLQNEFAQGIVDGANSRIAVDTSVSGNVAPKVLLVEGTTTLSVPASTSININDGLLAFTGLFKTPTIHGDGALNFTGASQILAANRGTSYLDVAVHAQTLTLDMAESLEFDRVNSIGTLKVNGFSGQIILNAADALPGTNVSIVGQSASMALLQPGHYTFDVTGGAGKTLTVKGPSNGIAYVDSTIDVASLQASGGSIVVSKPIATLNSLSVTGGTTTMVSPVNLSAINVGDGGALVASGHSNSLLLHGSASVDIGPGITSLSTSLLSQSINLIGGSGALSTFVFDLDRNNGVAVNDLLSIDQFSLSFSPNPRPLGIVLHPTAAVQVGDVFTLMKIGSLTGTSNFFNGLAEGSIFTQAGLQFSVTYKGGDGNDVAIRVVPEPGITGIALATLLISSRRNRRR